jgi:23S rRNA pseudouridine1911/1915/1917 synthase
LRWVVPGGREPERVDKYLAGGDLNESRSTLQRWIAEGLVLIDGQPCRARDIVHPGQVIEVSPGDAPRSTVLPDASVPFGVLYEDEHILVIDKPAGVVVHPAKGNWSGTLVSGILARGGFETAAGDPEDPMGYLRPGIVHRLDKGTSGVLVVARTAESRHGLKAMLAAHTVERIYRGIVVGVPAEGRIETLHGRHPRSRLRFTTKVQTGRRAVTNLRRLQRLGAGCTLVECRLETGRTHQIRVHLFEHAKTPLLGDPVYRSQIFDERLAEVDAALGRQALHAQVLGFEHPITGEHLRFEAPPPEDFRRALEALGPID